MWDDRGDGWFTVTELTSSERKGAAQLRGNVASFVRYWGRDHCAFFTLTDSAGIHPKEFARRWNSFLANEGAFLKGWVRVLEPQRGGRPHYHLLVAVSWSMRSESFDWQAFFDAQAEIQANGRTPRHGELTRRYRDSAGPETVAVWKRLRTVLPRYGLGRSEFLPVRKGHEALSEYVGKYLEAGLKLRRHNWKGVRRVETDRGTSAHWKTHHRQFSWNSEGGRIWRQRIGQIATVLGVAPGDFGGMRARLGARWAYHLRAAVISAGDDEWLEILASFRVDQVTEVETPAGGWPKQTAQAVERATVARYLDEMRTIVTWLPGSDDEAERVAGPASIGIRCEAGPGRNLVQAWAGSRPSTSK